MSVSKNCTTELVQKDVSTMRSKHWASIGALCLAMFCQTYLLMSAFPYSGFMAIFLNPDLSTETAGSYAGLISSSYMVGRAVSSFTWGKIADTIGRKPVLYLSFVLSGLCSIWFGLASSIAMALLSRFMMGMMNGLILVVKTAVTELAKGDEKLEARGMGLVMGMWGWGYLIGPAISGVLSEPVRQYPDSEIVKYFEPLLSKYPFLLPNLLSVILCFAGYVTAFFFVDETLPEEKIKTVETILKNTVAKLKSKQLTCKKDYANANDGETLPLKELASHGKSYSSSQTISTSNISGNVNENGYDQDTYGRVPTAPSRNPSSKPNKSHLSERKKTISLKKSIWDVDSTRHHLIGYWFCSFSNILLDEAFPLFCIATKGGLNLTETGIGKILSGAGAIFILGQYSVFSFLVSRYGIYKTLIIGSLLATPVTILMPFSLYLNRGEMKENDLAWSTYFYLSCIYACKNIGINVLISSITIATNRTVSADERASMNGISMLGGSVAKAVGPAFAGFMVSFLLSGRVIDPVAGSFFLFGVISFLGLFCVFFIYFVLGRYHTNDNLPTHS